MSDVIKELPELTPDLIEILGRPNFHCAGLANALRLKGQDLPFKSEHEQAAVIHFTLDKYIKDPVNWRQLCREALLEGLVQTNGRMSFGHVGHIGKACTLIEVTVHPSEGDAFEAFQIKGIFQKPYTLENGIFFNDSAQASQAIVKNLQAGEVFDTALLPEGWMNYEQFFTKLAEQNPAQ